MKDTDVFPLGGHLEGKKVALIVSGGIAAYETPRIARRYRQYGADVTFYPTDNALDFIGIRSLEWSSQNDVVRQLSGKCEHLIDYDAYVAAPATLSLIGDMASGNASDAARATLSSAFGKIQKDKGKRLIVVPTMHESMYDNPALIKNLEFLEQNGVKVIEPRMRNNKANLPKPRDIVAYTIRELSDDPLKDRKVLLNAGPCWAKIDSVRAITNIFRGRLGLIIAEELYMRGADSKLIYGPGGLRVPGFIDTTPVRYYEEMRDAVMEEIENGYEIGIFSSAVPDYKPSKVAAGKIKSDGGMKTLEFDQTEKIIKKVREKRPDLFMVTFKMETGISEEQLLEIGRGRLKNYQMVVANQLEGMSRSDYSTHVSYIMERNGDVEKAMTKKDTARILLDRIGDHFRE